MAVVVTGGYGFVGSWVARELASQGDEVILYDIRKRDLDYLDEVSGKIVFFQGDVLDFPRLAEMCEKLRGRIDGIIHAAANVNLPNVVERPYPAVLLNIQGTQNILEVARTFGIRKVLYVSSGAVYGDASGVLSEDTTPVKPSDLYGATKAASELLGHQYANHFGIDFRVARIYFAYGPGKMPSELHPVLRATFGPLEGLDNLEASEGGDQALDHTYVRDTAHGVVLLYRATNLAHKVFNISSGVPVTIYELSALAQKYGMRPVSVRIGPGKVYPRGGPLSIERARNELGFEPQYDAEQGVREYAKWVQAQLNRRQRDVRESGGRC